MICFFTYRGENSSFVRSSFVELGKDFYLPEDVTMYCEADYAVKEKVKRLVEIELEKQKGVVLVDICEFDNDEEEDEEEA